MAIQLPDLNPADARIAELVFEFVQFLLDDDVNLTPTGNLTGAARQRLRTRLDELMAAEEAGSTAVAEALSEQADGTAPPQPAEAP